MRRLVIGSAGIGAAAALAFVACSNGSGSGSFGPSPTDDGGTPTAQNDGSVVSSDDAANPWDSATGVPADGGGSRPPDGAVTSSATDGAADSTLPDARAVEDFNATASTFDCLKNTEWTPVGASLFKNVLGHTAEAVAVATSASGGTFPVGTVIQLVPTEASVKRRAGFSPASHDWEFFSLSVSNTGTVINARGGDAGVVNAFGGSCLNCHIQAGSQWDLLCGDPDGGNSHGCAALPLTGAQLANLRSSDPRCP